MPEMKADFSSLILSIASSAAMSLGLAPDHETGKIHVDKGLAKFNIDLLVMLKEKTKNNLTADETQLMMSPVSDLQNHFVKI